MDSNTEGSNAHDVMPFNTSTNNRLTGRLKAKRIVDYTSRYENIASHRSTYRNESHELEKSREARKKKWIEKKVEK